MTHPIIPHLFPLTTHNHTLSRPQLFWYKYVEVTRNTMHSINDISEASALSWRELTCLLGNHPTSADTTLTRSSHLCYETHRLFPRYYSHIMPSQQAAYYSRNYASIIASSLPKIPRSWSKLVSFLAMAGPTVGWTERLAINLTSWEKRKHYGSQWEGDLSTYWHTTKDIVFVTLIKTSSALLSGFLDDLAPVLLICHT